MQETDWGRLRTTFFLTVFWCVGLFSVAGSARADFLEADPFIEFTTVDMSAVNSWVKGTVSQGEMENLGSLGYYDVVQTEQDQFGNATVAGLDIVTRAFTPAKWFAVGLRGEYLFTPDVVESFSASYTDQNDSAYTDTLAAKLDYQVSMEDVLAGFRLSPVHNDRGFSLDFGLFGGVGFLQCASNATAAVTEYYYGSPTGNVSTASESDTENGSAFVLDGELNARYALPFFPNIRIKADLGGRYADFPAIGPNSLDVNLSGFKAGLGLDFVFGEIPDGMAENAEAGDSYRVSREKRRTVLSGRGDSDEAVQGEGADSAKSADDDQSERLVLGPAKIDGDSLHDGIFRAGDQLRIRVRVDNNGHSPLRGVYVRLKMLDGKQIGETILGKIQKIGVLEAGDTAYATFGDVSLPDNLPSGRIAFTLVAVDSEGDVSQPSDLQEVKFAATEKLEPLLPLNVKSKADAGRMALVIGVENYSDAGVGKARYAKNDAMTVQIYLSKLFGVPDDQIVTLLDSQATKSKIESVCRKFCRQKPDTIYVYFSGHGKPSPDGRGGAKPNIIPFDGALDDDESLIDVNDMVGHLRSQSGARVVAILDACFSGNPDGRSPEGLKKIKGIAVGPKFNVDSGGTEVLASSSDMQPSLTNDKSRHGTFTYEFLRVLKERGETVQDIKSVYGDVRDAVSKRTDGKQIPQLSEGEASEETTH